MEEIELASFQIISAVGEARSLYIEAIQEAKIGNFKSALEKIEEGKKMFEEGHNAHLGLIQKESNGEEVIPKLILLHAEDQLMSAEGFKIIAEEFIDVYKSIKK